MLEFLFSPLVFLLVNSLEVGNEWFWNFVLNELKKLFPYRNYNRAIETPEDIIPDEIEDLIEALKKKCNDVGSR